MPGYGDSDGLPGDHRDPRVQALEDSLAGLLGADTAIDLAGFSFGGLVAGHLCAHRGAVNRLALLGTASHGAMKRERFDMVDWRGLPEPEMMAALRHNLGAFMLHAPRA